MKRQKEPIQPWSPRNEWVEAQCAGRCSVPSRSWLQLALGAPSISGLICRLMVEPCPLGDASHLLWLGGWEMMGISPGLAPKPGLKPCLDCQHIRGLAGFTLRFLLDSVWLGGHLGDFTSWDLHLCACWKAQMAINSLHMNIGSLP